jgi:8-oxo-dGTP pyrophosphatase MutT (NUDIX family)
MEQRNVFPDRAGGGLILTREVVIERLAAAVETSRRRSNADARRENSSQPDERGDHDLNPGFQPEGPLRPAAVLVPLIDRDEGLTVLLTRRTDHLNNHAGQISFPGGRVDPDDKGPVHTALRETEEEIGLAGDAIDIVGRLDDYVVRTGFLVTPVVGVVAPPFDVKPDVFEVAEVFEVPLDFVMDHGNHRREHREINGVRRHFYAIPYNEYYIWGATAGMLRNLVELLARPF